MKLSKKILNLTLMEQVDLLKKRVYITNKDFYHKKGIIVSIKVNVKCYWVLLDNQYRNKKGKYSRLRLFKESEIKLVDL